MDVCIALGCAESVKMDVCIALGLRCEWMCA